MNDFSWIGSEKDFVDERDVRRMNRVAVGRFGGNSSAGQTKSRLVRDFINGRSS